MPTQKPRIIVTLDPDDKAALDELSAVSGASVSSIVRQLIQEAVPALRKTVMVIRQARVSPAEAFDQVADALAAMQFRGTQAELDIGKRKTLRRAKRK